MSNPTISIPMTEVDKNRSMDFIGEIPKSHPCTILETAKFGTKLNTWVKILMPNGSVVCVRPMAFKNSHVAEEKDHKLVLMKGVKFTFERKKNSDGDVTPGEDEPKLDPTVTVAQFEKLNSDLQERYEYNPATKAYKLMG